MTLHRPLVIVDGNQMQLPLGDGIDLGAGVSTEAKQDDALVILSDLAQAMNLVAGALSLAKDPTTGRLRVVQDGAAGTAQAVSVSSGTVTTVTTVAGVTLLNGYGPATGPIPSLQGSPPAFAQMQSPALELRNRIQVS